MKLVEKKNGNDLAGVGSEKYMIKYIEWSKLNKKIK